MAASDCNSPDEEGTQLDSVVSANAQDLPNELGSSGETKRPRRPGHFWKKPPSKIYADNFGFGVNRYQCMIDYLDSKDYGGHPKKSDHRLPLLEDRCLDSYSSKKPFKFYENSDIDDYIEKGEKIRSQIRQNDVASPGNVLRRTHTNWSMTKKYVQLVKKSNVIDYRKIREEAEREALGIPTIKALKSVGVSFALQSMDPLNLTLMTAHNNLDHAIHMTSRRDRLNHLDDQLTNVVGGLSEGTSDLDRRARQEMSGRNRMMITPYDNAQTMGELAMVTEDLAARNKLRRQLEFQALEEGVDDIMRYDRSRNRMRNNLRSLDDTVVQMSGDVSTMLRKHRAERGDDSDISVDVLSSMARRKARKMLNLDVDDADVNDPELARLKMRRAHWQAEPLDDPAVRPFHKYNPRPDCVSDVQSRVLARAGQIAGQTSTQRHINNRARYVNIYVPKYDTADPGLIVLPTRTELNIDHMAKTLAAKGRIQRRFDVDDEGDLPVSGLNTYAREQYCNRQGMKPIDVVPSNSLRVRSAVCRARQRNALQGR